MTFHLREPGCYWCGQITSGDCGRHVTPDVVSVKVERPTLWLGDLYKQGYLAGQLAMRERVEKAAWAAFMAHEECQIHHIMDALRALQPEEPK